jgi:surface antigen
VRAHVGTPISISLILLFTLVTVNSRTDAAPSCGTELSSYRGIPAKSNGIFQWKPYDCTTRGTYGDRYQCVEYVRRFYEEALGVDTSCWRGNAVTYFANASNFGLIRYANGGQTQPVPDDIVVFSNHEEDDTGHVAIVTNVTDTEVTIIEQNWSVTGTATLELKEENGTYTVTRPQSAYVVLGWLRRETSPTVVIQPGPVDGVDAFVTNVFGSPEYYEAYKNLIRVGGWGDYYYGLIRFPLENLPGVAQRAMVRLYAIPTQPASVPLFLDRVDSTWDESVTWATKPLFIQYRQLPAPVIDAWYEIDITDLYNSWQSGASPNYGIQLRPNSPNGVPQNEWAQFYSSDYTGDPSLRPQLVVTPAQ